MKNALKSIVAAAVLASGLAHAGDEYVGLSLTKPLGKEGFGLQLLVRRDNLEVRAGADSNSRYQLGGGLTAGEDYVASGGFALSNYHRSLVPYLGVGAEVYGDWEVGAVSYNTDLNYLTVGKRFGDDDEGSDRNSNRLRSGDGEPDSGGSDPDGDSGGSGGDDSDSGGGSGGGHNHSGQGDGTNPGNTDQDNGGADNPGGSS
ncbi:MAG: hypothetical protein PVI03_01600 [Candidatus Thorarchaeota archaeon]